MTSSMISFSFIVLIVVFWFYMLLKVTFILIWKLKKVDDSAETGQPINGTVISSTARNTGKNKLMKITVEFQNFSQALITEEFQFIDSRSEENRYAVGKRIMLFINQNAKGGPSAKIGGGKAVVGKFYLFMSVVLVGAYVYGTYRLFSFCNELIHGDWNNLDELFAVTGEINITGFVFLGVLLFNYFLFKYLGSLFGTKSKSSDRELKYFGDKAVAAILKYEDTGMTINDSPMVKFYYTYKDKYGTTHNGEDKKLIGKLDIGLLPTTKEIDVIYLSQTPGISKFATNLKPSLAMGGCLNGVVLLMAFIFSCILMGMFLSSILVENFIDQVL